MEKASSVYSICGMCAVRCPIRVEIEGGRISWIEGNPHAVGIEGALCAKGSAGLAFEYDDERPQSPMIREGARGEGKWKKASWDEALDYIAKKIENIRTEHGSKAIAITDRGGPFTDLTKSFIKALGSPNYADHDDTCAKNVNMAVQSLLGYGRGDLGYDFANSKYIVLFGRNVFESLQVKEVNDIMDALQKGCKLVYIDIRATVTASKAHRFMMINPGTDYAMILALMNVIIKESLYDRDFVGKYFKDFSELESFITPYTPSWAEKETGIPSYEIINTAREAASAKPSVIFHGGWMLSRYIDSFYASRGLYMLNALLGSIETKGGLIIAKGAKDAGKKGLRSLGEGIPEPPDKIVDADMPNKSLGTGHIVNFYKAIKTGKPYPIRALFAYRYDPIASLPDPDEQKMVLNKLDLLVSIDVNYSQTGWFSDVILPEATYLERSNIIGMKKGQKPQFIMRRQSIPPRYDSKPAWEIFTLLANKLGAGQYFPWKNIEDIWNYQLEHTGYKIEDFYSKGFVTLSKDPILMPRDDIKFTTPSGKIEIISEKITKIGAKSLAEYKSPKRPTGDMFRLVFGRSGVHTHAQTQNNLYLNEILPENHLWINEKRAQEMGIANGDVVEVSTDGYTGKIKAFITPYIHPEAVFMYHGFGNDIPLKTRSFGKGLRDTKFQVGLLETVDPVGGGVAYLEAMIRVKKA